MSPPDSETHEQARATYYAEARSWAEDRQDRLRGSRRIAWIVAAIAIAIAALEALALIALAPLKTVVPYTLLVDRNTGFVEALDPAHPLALKPQAALTQSLLAQYVVARESFDIDTLPEQYRKVALWSAEGARRAYLALMPQGNPESPLSRYPRNALVETHIESVSPMGSDAALVRFYTERRDARGGAARSYWVAMLRYRYSGEPMALADRLVNPLGFQVVQYRRDQEAPPPPETAPPPPPPVAMPLMAAPSPAAIPARPPQSRARPGVIQTL